MGRPQRHDGNAWANEHAADHDGNDDDALTALLGVGRRTDMAPAAAVDDALRDIRLHELATMAAMQEAVRSIMNDLSPETIRASIRADI